MDHSEEVKSKPGKSHYCTSSYDTKERFISYWHQIDETMRLAPRRVLEVGIGNGFVSRYLMRRGIAVTTLDVVAELEPRIVGSVLSLPFEPLAFDMAVCCEVLEHLPYEAFPRALGELRRVSRGHVLLSLPDHTPVYRFNVEVPRLGEFKRLIPHPFPRPGLHSFDGEHHWIIGTANYPLSVVTQDIEANGLTLLSTYRVFEFYGHRFFILKKV